MRTLTRVAWQNMKDRCRNPRHPLFKDYGGRGITVCQRWLDDFRNFLSDMGEKPSGLSIDRINNDGNYEPGNCKWSTSRQQTRNSRRTKLVTHNGKTQCAADWAEELKMNPKTLGDRLKRGWPAEEALVWPTPKRPRKTPSERCRTYRLRKKLGIKIGHFRRQRQEVAKP